MTIEQITNKIFDTSMSRTQMKKFLESEVVTKDEAEGFLLSEAQFDQNDNDIKNNFTTWLKNKRKEK